MDRLSALYDFRVDLGKGLLPRSEGFWKHGYLVGLTHVAGTEIQAEHIIAHFPYTEEGYTQADATAQRLVLALEVSTQKTRTGLTRPALAVEYVREQPSHEEAVE